MINNEFKWTGKEIKGTLEELIETSISIDDHVEIDDLMFRVGPLERRYLEIISIANAYPDDEIPGILHNPPLWASVTNYKNLIVPLIGGPFDGGKHTIEINPKSGYPSRHCILQDDMEIEIDECNGEKLKKRDAHTYELKVIFDSVGSNRYEYHFVCTRHEIV
ncbi:hypothetical protein N0G65_003567 [Providencia rettgeri]|nr:hypothetical protein [Providencia rettgeri]